MLCQNQCKPGDIGRTFLKYWMKNMCQPEILCPVKMFFKIKVNKDLFPHKQNPNEYCVLKEDYYIEWKWYWIETWTYKSFRGGKYMGKY